MPHVGLYNELRVGTGLKPMKSWAVSSITCCDPQGINSLVISECDKEVIITLCMVIAPMVS